MPENGAKKQKTEKPAKEASKTSHPEKKFDLREPPKSVEPAI